MTAAAAATAVATSSANKTQTAALKRKARASDDAYTAAATAGEEDARAGRPPEPGFGMDEAAYLAGYESARPKRSTSSNRSGSSGSSKRSTSSKPSGSSKRSTSSARRRGGRARSRAARQIARPIEGQLVSGMTALGAMFALAVLYNALANAQAAAGVIDAAARAVRWLDSPRSIPYGGN